MWNFKYKNQYLNYVSDLMQDTAVQSMRLLPQHRAGVSCYHHSVLVSYASWRVCDWLGLDARAAARGGLLHDFYLYNWRDAASHPGIRHGSQHPEVALRNARARFSLTWREEDIIRSHMFPYTPTKVYRCLESAVVSTMDKLCAAAELVGLVPLLTRFRRETPFWLDADWGYPQRGPRKMGRMSAVIKSPQRWTAAGALRVFPSGKVFRQTERRPIGGAFFTLLWKVHLTYRPCCAIT